MFRVITSLYYYYYLLYYNQVDDHASLLYDSVLLYALALQDAILLGHSVQDLDHISSLMFNRNFTGTKCTHTNSCKHNKN